MKNRILFGLIAISCLLAQADVNITYEMKYGDGSKITNVTSFNPDTSVYNYFENLIGVNVTFDNGLYIYSQLEYSDPPILGTSSSKLNNLIFEYTKDNSFITIGNLYTLIGRGLSLNTFQDQNIDFDNSIKGLTFEFDKFENIRFNTIIGKGIYNFRFNPADEVTRRSLVNSIVSFGFESDFNSLGVFQLNLLQKQIELDELEIGNFSSDETLLGEDLSDRQADFELDFSNGDTLDYQTTNIAYSTYLGAFDVYIEKSWVKYDKILGDATNGSMLYGSVYADLDGFGLTYEYKNYNVPYYIFSVESAPTVFMDNPSILVSRNNHSMNYGDEIGHQVEVIGQVADNINLLVNGSIAYRHNGFTKNIVKDNYNGLSGNWDVTIEIDSILPSPNFYNILHLSDFEEVNSLFPFRQAYLELNGWVSNDELYFKLGFDYYDEVTKYHNQETIEYNLSSINDFWWNEWNQNYFPEYGLDSTYADNIFESVYDQSVEEKISENINNINTFDILKYNFSKTHAFTLPTQFTLNPKDGYSLTAYLEQQWKTVDINKNEMNGLGEIDNSTSQFEEYYNQYVSISLGLPSNISFTIFNDIENHEKSLGDVVYSDKTNSWTGYDITFNLSSEAQFSIFYGSQKGGRVCANGVCADQPGFEDGFKLTYRSIF